MAPPTKPQADGIARWVAVAVFVVGLALVVGPALLHLDQAFANPYESKLETTTVTTMDGKGKASKIVESEKPEASSLFADALGAGGMLLLRIGIAALAAFIAGAVVQRVLLGAYAFKAGPVEFPTLEETLQVSGETIVKLAKQVDALGGEMVAQRTITADALRTAAEAIGALAAVVKDVDVLEKRVAKLEPK